MSPEEFNHHTLKDAMFVLFVFRRRFVWKNTKSVRTIKDFLPVLVQFLRVVRKAI